MKVITLEELGKEYRGTYSVKADTVRGREERSYNDLKVGDYVLIDNHFIEIVENYSISAIENMTESEAQGMAIDTINIKGFNCYFIDFKGYFKYGVLVFKNNHHIKYANDYELHHNNIKSVEELKKYYIESLNNKLFLDSELSQPINNYDEYRHKDYFLRNYWSMQFDYLSIFAIEGTETARQFEIKKPYYPFYSDISFCYFKDEAIVKNQLELFEALENNYKAFQEDDEAFRQAIRFELSNFEFCYSHDYIQPLHAIGKTYNQLTDSQRRILAQECDRQYQLYA